MKLKLQMVVSWKECTEQGKKAYSPFVLLYSDLGYKVGELVLSATFVSIEGAVKFAQDFKEAYERTGRFIDAYDHAKR